MTKAVAKIVFSIVCVLLLLTLAVTILSHFTNAKRGSKEFWGGYGLPTEFHDH